MTFYFRQLMRRGLSAAEMDNLPAPLFHKFVIFDTYLEPQSPVFQDMQQAMLQYTITMNNANMTEKFAKKIKPSQFSLIKSEERVFKSPEEMIKEMAKKEEQKQAAVMSMFDPALVEKLKKAQK